MAVRIDDDLSAVDISFEVNLPEVVDPSESVPDELKSNKKSKEDGLGGDLTGRQVIFGKDGKMGVVVVHRPPMIFVYKDNGNDEDPESAEGSVTVLDNLFPIDAPSNAKKFDSFGRSVSPDTSDDTKILKRARRHFFFGLLSRQKERCYNFFCSSIGAQARFSSLIG